jgi:hypothetical protein
MIGALTLAGDLVDRLGETLDVGGGDTGNGDTAVLGGVDRVLLGQGIHLLRLQTSVGEHTDLSRKVRDTEFKL